MIPAARRVTLSLIATTIATTGMAATNRTAQARSVVVIPYPSGEVWPSTIRFLRVDHDYPIKEKDEPAGYVLFDLPENKRAYRAALEMVRTIDSDGRASTQIICTIQDLPRRYEAILLDKLTAKVRDERGPPAPPPRKPPPPTEPPGKDGKPEGKPEAKPEPKPPGDLSGLPGPPMWGPPP